MQMFSLEFQRDVLKLLFTNLNFANNYGILLKEEYFESKILSTILRLSLDYINTYNKELDYNDVLVLVEDYVTRNGFTKETYNHLKEEVRLIYKVHIKSEQFIIDQMLKFIRRQELKLALSKSIDILQQDGSYELVLQHIDKAVSIGSGINDGYTFKDIFNLPEELNKYYASDKLLKTGYMKYDGCFEGGWAPGELHVFIGGPKTGKSTLACNLGVFPLALNKAVFHVSLEISALTVLRKYAARITGLSYTDMLMVDRSLFLEKLERFNKYKPLLFVQHYPMHSTNAITIRSWISRIRSKSNINPGLIIIDWDDCLIPSNGEQETLYLNSGGIYSDLKQLAEYFNCPVVTFAQPIREAWSKPDRGEQISHYEISHSAQKIHFCDSVSSINFPMNKDEGVLYVDLVRRGLSSIKIPIRRDYNRAIIEEI